MRHPLLLVLAIAVVLRAAVFFAVDHTLPESGDAPNYYAIGRSLAAGGGYSLDGEQPTATRVPLYPLLVSVVMRVTDRVIGTVFFLQLLLDALVCLLVYGIAERLHGSRIALYAAGIWAVYLPSALRAATFMTETLFLVLVVTAVYCLVRKGRGWTLCAGIAAGCACLTRPNGIIITGFLAAWLAWEAWKRRASLRTPVLFLVTAVLVYMPWVIRNYRTFDTLIPVSTYSGITLYNSYILADRGYGFNQIRPEHRHVLGYESEVRRDRELTSLTVAYILSHPGRVLAQVPLKTSLAFYPFNLQWLYPAAPLRLNPFFLLVLIFAAAALVIRRWGVVKAAPVIAVVLLSLVFTCVMYYGSPRLRHPYDPFLVMLAAGGAVAVMDSGRRIWWMAGAVAAVAAGLAAGQVTALFDRLRELL